MSLLPLAAEIRRVAAELRQTEAKLRRSAQMVADQSRRNIDRRQVAGVHRPASDVTGTPAGIPMQPLAAYTVAKREAAGIHHDHPLKASGRLYREIGVRRADARRAIVGGTTARARRLLVFHYGTAVTGKLSTDLLRPVPPRNPVGYDDATLRRILDLWEELIPRGGVSRMEGRFRL